MVKPLWKVTITTRNLSSFALYLNPHIETRIYRWHWQARWAAFWAHSIVCMTVRSAKVEPYWPGDNIVPLERRA